MEYQITINNNGSTQNVELISYFELLSTGKRYLFYTLNERVENGLVKMYASRATNEGKAFILQDEMTDDEWNNLKMIMKNILTGVDDANVKYITID